MERGQVDLVGHEERVVKLKVQPLEDAQHRYLAPIVARTHPVPVPALRHNTVLSIRA